jgi:hypothetical protein
MICAAILAHQGPMSIHGKPNVTDTPAGRACITSMSRSQLNR